MEIFAVSIPRNSRSQWPRGLRRRSAAARLLRSWVRIPPEAWTSVCFEGCVQSGRGLCDELITRPEESYRLCCVVVCDSEAVAPKTNKQKISVYYDPAQLVILNILWVVRVDKNFSFHQCAQIGVPSPSRPLCKCILFTRIKGLNCEYVCRNSH